MTSSTPSANSSEQSEKYMGLRKKKKKRNSIETEQPDVKKKKKKRNPILLRVFKNDTTDYILFITQN